MKFLNTLRVKISLVFIVFIFIILTILFFNNLYAMEIIRTQVAETHTNMFTLYGMKVDDSLDEVRNYIFRTINMVENNMDIVKYNSSLKGSLDYYSSILKVRGKLKKDINYYSILDGLFVYSQMNDDIITFYAKSGIANNEKNEILKKMLYGNIYNNYNMQWQVKYLCGEYNLVYFASDSNGSTVGAVVSLSRLLALRDFQKSAGSLGIVIMSDDGTVLLSSGDKIPVSDIRDNVETLQESDYKTIRDSSSGGKHLVIANKTDRANILFIEVFNEKMLLKKLNIFQVTILLIPVGLVITLIIYFIFIQHIVLNPMNELEKGINRINESNLDFKLEEKGAVEFKLIIKVFNNMVTQIHDLKIDIYEERLNLKNKELEKKKSELINLQLRINPHFFANSLNIIYNLAALEKYKTVQDMAILLSRYFRYMIQTKQVLTELKNEIDFVKDYLEIQKLRFTKRLEYSIDVDKQLLSLMLPSLLIQPFVENSIVHGFPAKEDVMYIIIITAKLAYDGHKKYINIRITDNGKGFSKKDIANFSNPEYFTDINERHIGISNVYNRLKIIYGQSAGILLHNNENGGAEVNISIPAGS